MVSLMCKTVLITRSHVINLLLNRTRVRMQQVIDITNKNADEEDQGRGGAGKLRSQWKDVILPKKADNTPVYNIKPENCNYVKTNEGIETSSWHVIYFLQMKTTLREMCPNMEFFLVRIFLYSIQIQENTDQKNFVSGHFSHRTRNNI